MHYDLPSRKPYSGYDIGTSAAPTESAVDAGQRKSLGVFTDTASIYAYEVVVSPHFEVDVSVMTNLRSAEDLQSYRTKVQEIATQLKANGVDKALVVLTFKRPVSPAEFRNLIKKYNLSVEAFEARAVNDRGEKTTVGGVPEGEDVFPQDIFEVAAAWSSDDTRLVGITSFEGMVNLDEYERLSNDPLCFLADVLPAQVIAEAKQLIAERGLRANMPVDVNLNDVFWVMEAFQSQGDH
ncbi:MAG: hypothetical protein SXV54_19925 [Chloroflexota bacterium]|nr:hypothetical protein [Chloroflexota bacterium]